MAGLARDGPVAGGRAGHGRGGLALRGPEGGAMLFFLWMCTDVSMQTY